MNEVANGEAVADVKKPENLPQFTEAHEAKPAVEGSGPAMVMKKVLKTYMKDGYQSNVLFRL